MVNERRGYIFRWFVALVRRLDTYRVIIVHFQSYFANAFDNNNNNKLIIVVYMFARMLRRVSEIISSDKQM